jgi:outer membrane lipoprotein carrier protein
MRRAAFLCGIVAGTLAVAQEPLPSDLHGAQKLAALVQRVTQVQAGTATLQAHFEQRKTSRLLAEPSVSRGRFYFKAPDTVRWEYEQPQPMTVLLAEGIALTYRPAEKRAERVEVGRMQRRVFRFIGAAEPLDRLKQYFSFTFRDPGAKGNYTLLLEPSTHLIKKRLKKVELEIDRDRMMPIAISYEEADGDTTAYRFTEIVTNKPLDDSLFRLVLPPDVQVVELKVGSND